MMDHTHSSMEKTNANLKKKKQQPQESFQEIQLLKDYQFTP